MSDAKTLPAHPTARTSHGDSGWTTSEKLAISEYASRCVAAERERIDRLLQEHQHVSLETLEYLQAMREGPTPEEWAELDANARTPPAIYDETDVLPRDGGPR